MDVSNAAINFDIDPIPSWELSLSAICVYLCLLVWQWKPHFPFRAAHTHVAAATTLPAFQHLPDAGYSTTIKPPENSNHHFGVGIADIICNKGLLQDQIRVSVQMVKTRCQLLNNHQPCPESPPATNFVTGWCENCRYLCRLNIGFSTLGVQTICLLGGTPRP